MIVPGSIFGMNHAFAWYAIVRNKNTGKQRTYWMNGNHVTRQTVADHIARHMPNVEVITIDQCAKQPDRLLVPVPPEDFEFGIRAEVERSISGEMPEPERPQTKHPSPIVTASGPIKLKPIGLTPLSPL